MDLVAVIEQARKDIIARASLIELRDAIRIAERVGDLVSARLFKDEMERRMSDD